MEYNTLFMTEESRMESINVYYTIFSPFLYFEIFHNKVGKDRMKNLLFENLYR